MNFFKLYIGDYLRDTGTLTLAQHGAYVLMLLEHYATEKPLPTGRELHRLLRADSKQEREAVDFIAAKFWIAAEGGIINARSAKEFARAEDVSEKNRAIALAREAQKRARTEHEQSTKRAQNVPRQEHEQSTNQTPDTRHQKEIPPLAVGASADGVLVSTAPRSKRRTRTPGAMPLPDDWKPSEEDVSKLARELSIAPGVVARNYVEGFRDLCLSRGYLYRDFDAAFRNCVRQDWPAIRKANGRPQSSAMDDVFGNAH